MVAARLSALTVPMVGKRLSKAQGAACAAFSLCVVITMAPASAQTPAFLPAVASVPPTQRMALDGTWTINTIHKRVRIEAGRAYAVDSWLHLFVLKIEPGMVVIQNIRPTGPGRFVGDDLPLVGQWTATLQADRTIRVSVAGIVGPTGYTMTPVQLDDPNWYAHEMSLAGLPPQYAGQPYPGQPYPGQPIGYPTPPPPGYQPLPQPAPPPPDYGWTPAPQPELPVGAPPPPPLPVIVRPRQPQSGEIVNAIEVGPAQKWGCKGRNVYFTPHDGGQCWSCPDGYRRTATPIWKANSCNKRGLSRKTVNASFVRSAYGCGAGEFHRGKSCYRCPRNTRKISALGVNPLASCVVD